MLTYTSLFRRPRSWLTGLLFLGFVFSLTAVGCDPQPVPKATVAPTPKPLGTNALSIINGTPDLDNPAIGALSVDKSRTFCTGTLITSQLVLTAAHCISSARSSGIDKIFFRVDIADNTDPTKTFRSEYHAVQELVSNPSYNGGQNGHENDLGLMVLTKKVTNVTPLPISRAPMDKKWEGTTVRVVGYGLIQTRPTNKSADLKYAADIPIEQINARSFIHFDKKDKKSACHGDSGGPALYKVFGKLRVVGVTSVAYQATPNPSGQTYCDGGAISTRPDANINFLRPYLIKYSDGDEACTDDLECGSCGTCPATTGGAKQICQPKLIQQEAINCKACRSNQDCGTGVCYRFPNGYRCIQACTTDFCCPTGQYCDPTLPINALKSFCAPVSGSCPDLPCKEDKDCGLGEVCNAKGICEPNRPKPSANYCKPCYTSSQCGDGNFCYNSKTTTGYCVQACGAGRFCPEGTACKTLSPGIDQCMPIEGCFQACDKDNPCATGFVCKDSKCTRTDGGEAGDFCTSKVPCALGHECIEGDYGSRCVKTCGSPAGTAGNACDNKACKEGLECIAISGLPEQVCLEQCTSTCKTGGRCFRLTSSTQVCLCTSDSECSPDQFCNYAQIGVYGAGACSPKPKDFRTQCRPGETCAPIYPVGNACRASEGDRTAFTTCTTQMRCAEGLDCLRLSSNAPSLCYENCRTSNSCSRGGVCISFRSGARYCMCQNNTHCPKGTICKLLFNTGQGSAGYCDTSKQTECDKDSQCPAEHKCDQNKCVFDPSKANEPWPETHPELPPEPKPEPGPEPTPEAGPEPGPELGPEAGPEPVVAEEPVAKEQAPVAELPPPPNNACGCTTAPDSPLPPSAPWVVLSFFALFFFRRR